MRRAAFAFALGASASVLFAGCPDAIPYVVGGGGSSTTSVSMGGSHAGGSHAGGAHAGGADAGDADAGGGGSGGMITTSTSATGGTGTTSASTGGAGGTGTTTTSSGSGGGINCGTSANPLGPPSNYHVGGDVFTLGDMDGDALLDLVLISGDFVNVSLNTGGGFAMVSKQFSVLSPVALATAQLDGDAKTDVVVATDAGMSAVSVILRTGTGPNMFDDFVDGGEYLFGTPGIMAIAVADVNGDGKIDVIGAMGPGVVEVMLNDGTGTLGAPTPYNLLGAPTALAVADLDGSNGPDIIVSTSSGTVNVLLNNGNGTFSAATPFPCGPAPVSLTVADIDGDQRLDIATANDDVNTNASFLLNMGGGQLDTPILQSFNKASSIAAADFNNDGHTDVAALARNGINDYLYLLLGNGQGGVLASFGPQLTPGAYHQIATADLNNDGKTDVVYTSPLTGDAYVSLNVCP